MYKSKYKRNVNECKQIKNNINEHKLTPREVIELVKNSISLEQGFDRYLGINLSAVKGRKTKLIPCPFHQEKTGSFAVTPSENKFNCFGCGVKGDVINLVSLVKGISLGRAAFILAEDFSLIEKVKQADPRLKKQIKAKVEDRELELEFKQKEKEMYDVLIHFKKMLLELPKKNIKQLQDMDRYKNTYDFANFIDMYIDLMAEAEELPIDKRVQNYMATNQFIGEKVCPILKVIESKGVK